MNEKGLTRSEVDSLLGRRLGETAGAGHSRAAFRHPLLAAHGISPQAWHALGTLYETASRRVQAALVEVLRRPVEVEMTGLEALEFGHFACSLPSATCLAHLRVEPLADEWILEISPALLHQAIDCLLGGVGDVPEAPRALTEIERGVARRLLGAVVEPIVALWQPTAELKPVVERVDSCLQTALEAAGDVPIALVSFRIALATARGSMHLCMPLVAAADLAKRLAAAEASQVGPAEQAEDLPAAPTEAPSAPVELRVRLETTTDVSEHELAELQVGDIILTEHRADEPLVVEIDGRPAFHARPTVQNGQRAVRVEGPLEETEGRRESS